MFQGSFTESYIVCVWFSIKQVWDMKIDRYDNLSIILYLLFPFSQSCSTFRQNDWRIGISPKSPINFECKLNKPIHIGVCDLHRALRPTKWVDKEELVQSLERSSSFTVVVTALHWWLQSKSAFPAVFYIF